jgi:hypothetical protein
MAASSNKQKKDLLTEDDISKVSDKEDESDIFSEESDDLIQVRVRTHQQSQV